LFIEFCIKYFLLLYPSNLYTQHRRSSTTFGKGWIEGLGVETAEPWRTELHVW